ncbi:hypothetical protein BD413DRAFT_533767 [Trametes elegans]|nr:hypothetical protein BD413DRAFT_533767 [Trametes elegans]
MLWIGRGGGGWRAGGAAAATTVPGPPPTPPRKIYRLRPARIRRGGTHRPKSPAVQSMGSANRAGNRARRAAAYGVQGTRAHAGAREARTVLAAVPEAGRAHASEWERAALQRAHWDPAGRLPGASSLARNIGRRGLGPVDSTGAEPIATVECLMLCS